MQAACAGDEVPVSTLAALGRKSVDDTCRDLWAALRDGLMIRVGDVHRFTHDRVRQAAYLLIPEAERAGMHLAIARALLAATRPEDQEARVFELVTQYNLGRALIDDPAERARVARLDLVAGRRARASTAYESAIHHLSAGIDLLSPDPFAREPDLAYDLHLELAACVYLHGDFGRAAALLAELEPRRATKLQKAAARRLEVDLYTSTDQLDEAVARGAQGLSLFGIDLPPHPPRAEVERGYDRVWRLLGDRPIEDLLELPPLTDPEIRAAQDILAVLFAPALNTDPNLSLLV
jgi:predicted ATPase